MSFMKAGGTNGDGAKVTNIGDNRSSVLREALGSMSVAESRLFFVRLLLQLGVPRSEIAQVFRANEADVSPDGVIPDRGDAPSRRPWVRPSVLV